MADDEQWKGEGKGGEQPPEGTFVPLVYRMSDAEREALRSETLAKVPIGELTYASLPLFNEVTRCKKCGSVAYDLQYHDGHKDRHKECAAAAGEHEHLHRRCTRCNYVWIERVLVEDA